MHPSKGLWRNYLQSDGFSIEELGLKKRKCCCQYVYFATSMPCKNENLVQCQLFCVMTIFTWINRFELTPLISCKHMQMSLVDHHMLYQIVHQLKKHTPTILFELSAKVWNMFTPWVIGCYCSPTRAIAYFEREPTHMCASPYNYLVNLLCLYKLYKDRNWKRTKKKCWKFSKTCCHNSMYSMSCNWFEQLPYSEKYLTGNLISKLTFYLKLGNHQTTIIIQQQYNNIEGKILKGDDLLANGSF